MVPKNRDVELPPRNELLDDGVGEDLFVDERHPLSKCLVAVHHRCLGDSVTSLFDQRLHDERELELLGSDDFAVARKDPKSWHLNAVVGQHLLRKRLVAREQKPPGVAPRVRCVLKLQVTDDVSIEDRFSTELLEQVEHHVRLELFDRGAQRRKLVAQTNHQHVVPHEA